MRTYEAYAVAELTEKRPDGDAFNVLAAYFFGKNSEEKAMAMTMPVEMVDGAMAFVLPKADADAPPAPTDDQVTIGERPARTVVALPFPGVATPEEIERQRAKLGGRSDEGGPGSCGRVVHGAPVQLAVHDPLAAPRRIGRRPGRREAARATEGPGRAGPRAAGHAARGLERVPFPARRATARRAPPASNPSGSSPGAQRGASRARNWGKNGVTAYQTAKNP